jgi:hypothetical protein
MARNGKHFKGIFPVAPRIISKIDIMVILRKSKLSIPSKISTNKQRNLINAMSESVFYMTSILLCKCVHNIVVIYDG